MRKSSIAIGPILFVLNRWAPLGLTLTALHGKAETYVVFRSADIGIAFFFESENNVSSPCIEIFFRR